MSCVVALNAEGRFFAAMVVSVAQRSGGLLERLMVVVRNINRRQRNAHADSAQS